MGIDSESQSADTEIEISESDAPAIDDALESSALTEDVIENDPSVVQITMALGDSEETNSNEMDTTELRVGDQVSEVTDDEDVDSSEETIIERNSQEDSADNNLDGEDSDEMEATKGLMGDEVTENEGVDDSEVINAEENQPEQSDENNLEGEDSDDDSFEQFLAELESTSDLIEAETDDALPISATLTMDSADDARAVAGADDEMGDVENETTASANNVSENAPSTSQPGVNATGGELDGADESNDSNIAQEDREDMEEAAFEMNIESSLPADSSDTDEIDMFLVTDDINLDLEGETISDELGTTKSDDQPTSVDSDISGEGVLC